MERQTLLFSATLQEEVKDLVNLALKKPIRLQADPSSSTSDKLKQMITLLKEPNEQYREATLLYLAKELYKEKVIIFFKTKSQCHRSAILFGLSGLRCCELHGNLTQNQRIEAFEDFKSDKYDYLMATDLAARGLDIKEVRL